eukprot:gene9003-12166_t
MTSLTTDNIEPNVPSTPAPEKRGWASAAWAEIKGMFWLLMAVLAFHSFIAKPFYIPSISMMPTLLVGDYLLVNKFSYGYSRYSLPLYNPDWFQGRLFGSVPKRGDVIVFRLPSDPSIDYIKRLIGLPGDKIQVKGDVLYINDKPVPRVPEGTFTSDDSDTGGVGVQFQQDRYDS